ncbi:MAG: hypothetical protein ACOCW3_01070 [Spirochaetota bacterium]
MADDSAPDSMRAEELILDVYRQRREIEEHGREATRVVMNPSHYRAIQRFHAHLGDVPEGAVDYIDRYRLFDLEICIERVERPVVE